MNLVSTNKQQSINQSINLPVWWHRLYRPVFRSKVSLLHVYISPCKPGNITIYHLDKNIKLFFTLKSFPSLCIFIEVLLRENGLVSQQFL